MKSSLINATVIAIILGLPGNSQAQGVFDFADPCKKAERRFKSGSEALSVSAAATIIKWYRMTEPTAELRSHYVEAFRLAAFKTWSSDPTVAALIDQLGSTNSNFDAELFFMEKVYPKAVTKKQEDKAVRDMFQIDKKMVILPRLREERAKLEARLREEKSNLNAACKPDVVSQIFRATFGNAAIIIDRNAKAAKTENGDIAAFIRATSGISITDIGRQGILGGDSSELRKLANAVAGDENSELRKALRSIDETFNPARWKIELPKIETPKTTTSGGNPPKLEIQIPGIPGEVCIPWC